MSGRRCVVCDASALVAVLLDSGPDGRWATETVVGADLAAPSLLAFESANVIRRHELAGTVTSDQAKQAHADLLDLAVEQWPYELLAARAWELRRNLSSYDASCVALAELIDAPPGNARRANRRRAGLRCTIATPSVRRDA